MKILVVAHYQNDGSPTACFVHEQMKEYLRAGHEVLAIVPVAVGKRDVQGRHFGPWSVCRVFDGVRHLYLRYLTLSSYGEAWFNHNSAILSLRVSLQKILEDFQPDVIHAHTLGFDSEIGAWLKERLGCPLLVTTHGSDTDIPLQRGQTEALKKRCDKADRIVAVSGRLKERLATCGTKTPIYGIINGFVPRPVPDGITRKPHSMIQVSNLIPSKRVDVTIRAFAQLREKYPDMTLTIVGQGPLRRELEQLCVQLGVAEAVCFTGQLPNDQVFAKLCQSQFFVMVSQPEGFGIVYLEAMAAGCITIGTQGQGIADVIENGVNGFLVEADAPELISRVIEICLKDPQKASVIAESGCSAAWMLTWEQNANKYLKQFEEMQK